VSTVDVRMQQAYRDSFDATFPEDAELPSSLLLVEWDDHRTRRVETFDDPPTQVAGHQRRTTGVTKAPPPPRVADRRPWAPDAAEVENVPVPFRTQEGYLGQARVSTAFKPCVLAWLKTVACARAPLSSAPSTTDLYASSWRDGILPVTTFPSIATKSVNVPPTSTAIAVELIIAFLRQVRSFTISTT
jgi:hypothetical protein